MTERDPISTPALPGGLPFDASQIQFTPSGAGAVARSVQDALRAAIRGSDYSTAANFIAAVTSLTEAFGAATLNIGPQTGWTTIEKASYVDTAKSFFGARNLPALGPTQTNYFQFLGHDDNNTVANMVATYAVMTDNHPIGTRASSVGFEGDIYHTGAGTTSGEAGVVGFSEVDAGVVTTSYGVLGQAKVAGGTVTDSIGVYGVSLMTGGAATNTYAGRFAGPNHSGGTVANNYGVYIGRVGSGGTVSNYQLYIEGSGAGNPVVVDNAGNVGIGLPIPTAILNISGTAGTYTFRLQDNSTGDRLKILAQAATLGVSIESVNFAESAAEPMQLVTSACTVTQKFACNGAAAQAASTGYGTPTNGAKQASFDATAITLPNLAKAVAQLIIDLKAFGFLAA